MKSLKSFALIASLLPVLSFATSILPHSDVAPSLVDLTVVNVETEGQILKSTHHRPYSNFVIGISVDVALPNACTTFVGQKTIVNMSSPLPAPQVESIELKALGATNPLVDACIEIAVSPVHTVLTLDMNVLTGGFAPAQNIQNRIIYIYGAGLYNVSLNMSNQSVIVQPLKQFAN